MDEIKADPTVGLDAAIKAVPELAKDRETQAALLDATIDDVDRAGPGGARPRRHRPRRAGTQSITFMDSLGLTKDPVTTDQLVREDLLPAGD